MEKDVLQLKESMDILHELVSIQQEPLDTFEEMIIESKQNTIESIKDLSENKPTYYFIGGLLTLLLFFLI